MSITYSLPGFLLREIAEKCIEWAAQDMSRPEILAKCVQLGLSESECLKVFNLGMWLYQKRYADTLVSD